MPTTGLSLERREDKEKQIEECQTLKKTDPRSAASSWVGADAVPVLLSPRAMSDCEGPPTGEQKGFRIFICAHFLQGAYMCSLWSRKCVFCVPIFL